MQNEIMGVASETIEIRMILPELENLSFSDLRNIANSIDGIQP